MKMIKNIILGFMGMFVIFFGFAETSLAQEGQMTGEEIMKKRRHANMTMDQTSTVTMFLIDAQKNERKIVTSRFHKHYAGQEGLDSKSVFYTEFPPDQKGTGFLIWDYAVKGKPDDIWLYLPSLRSVRRMTTRDKNDSFMGSDLTFSDMGARRLDEDDHVIIWDKDGNCRGLSEPCYIIDSIPKDKDSPYGKKRYFISKKNWNARKIEFYDRNMKPLKLQLISWQKVGEVFAWKRVDIVNVQSKHKTIFEISDVKNDIGLTDAQFSDRMLERGGGR